jgi:hypothetical protein
MNRNHIMYSAINVYNQPDITEAYCLAKTTNDGVLCYPIRSLTFQEPELSGNSSYNIRANVELYAVNSGDVLVSCGKLLSEYKQIKEYDDTISALKHQISTQETELNRLRSHNQYLINQTQNLRKEVDSLRIDLSVDRYALFVDERASYTDHIIIMRIPLTDEFFKTLYWEKLFTQTAFVRKWHMIWETPCTYVNEHGVTMGCNHWFVVADANSQSTAIDKLLMYPDDKYEIIEGDRTYMYERLDEIWKDTFGISYPNIKEG